MIKRFLTMLILLAGLGLLPAWAAPGEDGDLLNRKYAGKKDGIEIVKIAYRSDGLKVGGLLFLARSGEPLPCVIFCHDGISGISREHRLSSIRLAKAGYAVFSPSYRGEDGYEGEIEIAKGEVRDVLNAIKMLRKIKQVDGDRIALAGASHGALISMMAAARTNDVKAVVAAYGVMDIYKWWDYLKKNNLLGKDRITRQTYGDGPGDRPQSFAIRNAVSFVKDIKCPVLVLQGAKDKIVPPEQAQYAKEALDREKVPSDVRIYPDCLHGFLVYAPYIDDADKNEKAQTEEAWKVMIDFLDKALKG
jgi:dipeptidyl aminopeptidase/acylaminoacyl peptidase